MYMHIWMKKKQLILCFWLDCQSYKYIRNACCTYVIWTKKKIILCFRDRGVFCGGGKFYAHSTSICLIISSVIDEGNVNVEYCDVSMSIVLTPIACARGKINISVWPSSQGLSYMKLSNNPNPKETTQCLFMHTYQCKRLRVTSVPSLEYYDW